MVLTAMSARPSALLISPATVAVTVGATIDGQGRGDRFTGAIDHAGERSAHLPSAAGSAAGTFNASALAAAVAIIYAKRLRASLKG